MVRMGMMACMLWGQGEGEQWVGHGVPLSRPPVPFQPGLPQRHLRVPRQHLEGGSLPGAVHTQEAEALQGAKRGYRQPCPCPQCHLSVCLALTSPGGMATQSRSTAGAFLRRYTCAAEPGAGCSPRDTHQRDRGLQERLEPPKRGTGQGPAPRHAPWSGPSAAGGGCAGGCCPPSPSPWPHPRPPPPARAAAEPVAWGQQRQGHFQGCLPHGHPTVAPRPVLTRAAGRSDIAAGG